MDKIISWVLENKLKCFCVAILLLFLPIAFVTIAYKSCFFNLDTVDNWTAGDLILYFVTFYSVVGTITLGCVAVWQNIKAQDINSELVKLQIYISNNQKNQEEFARIQESAKKYISSYNISIFIFSIMYHNIIGIENVISKIFDARNNAYSNSIHAEFFPCYTKSCNKCSECMSSCCEVHTKSQGYKQSLDIFEKNHGEYLAKYYEIANKLLYMLSRIDEKNKKELYHETLTIKTKRNIDDLALLTMLRQQGVRQNNCFEAVHKNRLDDMKYIDDERQRLVEYLASAQSLPDELAAIMTDVTYLEGDGFAELRKSLHRFADQCKKELNLIPNDNSTTTLA